MRHTKLSTKERIRRLNLLIEDCKKNPEFNPAIIQEYEGQVKELEKELKEEEIKRFVWI